MPIECKRGATGGKGNWGRFVDREQRVCAAGVPSAQAGESVAAALQQYGLADEAAALVGDAIVPPPPPRPLLPLRRPVQTDQRFAGPGASNLAALVNPPPQTKFQILADELKDTPYKSYWKLRLGKSPDATAMFPNNFDIEGTTYGRKYPPEGRLYDFMFPINPIPGQTPPSKVAGVQTCRNYCRPPYNPDLTWGRRSRIDKRGIKMKCCLTDNSYIEGKSKCTQINFIQADHEAERFPVRGKSVTPNNNIKDVPEGHTFGKVSSISPTGLIESLTTGTLNPERTVFLKCVAHLNSLRKLLSTRFLPSFFRKMYLSLKFYDKEKAGWLPKENVYSYCTSKLIRFDSKLIEPLLTYLQAFSDDNIEYKTFCHILNFKEPLPTLPKVPDLNPECLEYKTTYSEMTKPGQEEGEMLRAGVPSARYLDTDFPRVTCVEQCAADKILLPQEIDVKACISPSVLAVLHVNHRDMFAKREPHVVKRVFEAAGEKFTDERFNETWEHAKKYHSQGWVCYETFRRALEELAPKDKPLSDWQAAGLE